MKARKMVEYDAEELFRDESDDWKYCSECATFAHKEACEFIIWLPPAKDRTQRSELLAQMKGLGCSDELIGVVRDAMKCKAEFLLLYAG